MDWTILAPIIARYGIEAAFRLWENAANKEPVTPEKWDELKKLAKPYDDYINAAMVKKGVSFNG